MRKENYTQLRGFNGLASMCFLLVLFSRLLAASPELIREHIFLIDTSSSMTKLLAHLRVAMYEYANTIPIDGTSRVWIFTFADGLKTFSQHIIRQAKDKEDVEIFLASIETRGSATYIFRSLDGVFTKIEEAAADGKTHDFVIHLFTDGENNDSNKTYSFDKNISRFVKLREANDGRMELHYHTLYVKVSESMLKLIQSTEGVYLIPGDLMPPKADFSLPQVTLYDNASVTFINRTVGKVDTWHWSFGDGTPSDNMKDPIHTFKEPGKYSVELIAANPAGKSSARRQVVVIGGPPTANFEIENPADLYTGRIIRFRDASVGQIKSRSWDFNDGQGKSTDINPTYTYKQPRVYKVTLKLTGVYGEGPSSEYSKTINILPLFLDFSYNPDSPRLGEEIQFINKSIGPYERWSWDFNDGTKSNEHSPKHKYQKDGKYEVTLSGEGGGLSGKIAKTLLVRPRAQFALPRKSVYEGESIEIKDQSIGQITLWKWDLGDGTFPETRDVNHPYEKAGTYTIKLEVTGPGGTDSAKDEISVEASKIWFSFTPEPAKDGLPVQFMTSSVGEFKQWEWDLGDGGRSNEKDPQHIYQKPETYIVKLSATGPDGKPQTVSTEVRVEPVPPKAYFKLGMPEIKVGMKISPSSDCSGTISKYEWDMGDGSHYSGREISHIYQKPGEFEIILTVSNDYGQTDSHTETIKVTEQVVEPRLDFQLAEGFKSNGRVPLKIRIQNKSTGSIKSFDWNFGDGSRSDDVNPMHTYNQQGKYRITLAVSDVRGYKFESSESQAIIITALPPPPPPIWYLLPFVILGLCNIAVKALHLGWRSFSFSIDGEPHKHNGLRDKHFGDTQDGFDVCLERRLLYLGKQYFFKNPRENVGAEDNFGESLGEGSRLRQGHQVTVNDQVIYFQKFSDGKWSWVFTWFCITVISLAVLLVEQYFLNLF